MSLDSYTSREWALDLWDHGYSVVLVPYQAKRPAIPWKVYQSARASREQVSDWYAHGEHNIALLTGEAARLVVVDGDSPEAAEVIRATCAPTPLVVLTSKGAHFYYRHPGGARIPNAVRLVDDPPIDLRADGGLVIGPGSIHATGHRYLPEDDLESVLDLPEFDRAWFPIPETQATAPKARVVFHVSSERAEFMDQARRYLQSVPGATQGDGGDVHTYRLACKLTRGFCLDDQEALDLLLQWNSTCTPPWREEDLAAKIRHSRAYGTGGYGALLHTSEGSAGVLIRGWEP